MRLALITAFPDLHTNRRLAEAATRRGFALQLLAPSDRVPAVVPQAALLRVGLSGTTDSYRLADALASRGTRVMNRPEACAVAKDKWLTHCLLEREDVPQLPTLLLEPDQPLHSVLPDPRLGSFPLVVKTRRGSKGVGVHLARDIVDLQQTRARYAESGYSVLLQRFVRPLREFRAFVLGSSVRAVIQRSPAAHDFRANWHQGATMRPMSDVDPDLEGLAVRTHDASGLDCSAVDIVQIPAGYHVLEVNDSPGLQGIERATCLDLAGAVIDHLASLATA